MSASKHAETHSSYLFLPVGSSSCNSPSLSLTHRQTESLLTGPSSLGSAVVVIDMYVFFMWQTLCAMLWALRLQTRSCVDFSPTSSARGKGLGSPHCECFFGKMFYVFALSFVFLFLQVQSEDSVLLFVIAWTITEIIRYSFYTFSLLNHLPYLIKWAR